MFAIGPRFFYRVILHLCLVAFAFVLAVIFASTVEKKRAATGNEGHLHTGRAVGHAMEESPSPSLDYSLAWIRDMQVLSKAVNKRVYHVLAMKWNARSMSADVLDQESVASFIESLPLEGGTLLSTMQVEDLQGGLATLLYLNGVEDRRGYFNYCFERGEGLTPEGYDKIRTRAEKHHKSDWVNLDSMDQLLWYFSEWESNWKGLVGEGSRIKVYQSDTDIIQPPGNSLMTQRVCARWTYRRTTSGPVTLADQILRDGKALMADIEVYVENQQGAVRPYLLRYWYDSASRAWRLQYAIKYSLPKDPHGRIVI